MDHPLLLTNIYHLISYNVSSVSDYVTASGIDVLN